MVVVYVSELEHFRSGKGCIIMDGSRWIKIAGRGQDGFVHLLRNRDAIGVPHGHYFQTQAVVDATDPPRPLKNRLR